MLLYVVDFHRVGEGELRDGQSSNSHLVLYSDVYNRRPPDSVDVAVYLPRPDLHVHHSGLTCFLLGFCVHATTSFMRLPPWEARKRRLGTSCGSGKFMDRPPVCLLLQDLYKSCARGGGVKRGDVCYGMLRAAACVDESDHHALMYVRHGQTVREEGVDE